MSSQAISKYLARPYSKVLVRDETGGYVAEVLEFPGCITEGDTPDEAIRNLDEAMEDWLKAVLESRMSVPEPLASQGYSGRLVVRMPKWVHKEAARYALADGVSLNQWIVEAVAERLGAQRYTERLLERMLSASSSLLVAAHGYSIWRSGSWESLEPQGNFEALKVRVPMEGEDVTLVGQRPEFALFSAKGW